LLGHKQEKEVKTFHRTQIKFVRLDVAARASG
jgi:hypothetical protein